MYKDSSSEDKNKFFGLVDAGVRKCRNVKGCIPHVGKVNKINLHAVKYY